MVVLTHFLADIEAAFFDKASPPKRD